MSTAQFVNTLSCIRKSFGKPWVQSWACWASGGDFNPPTGCRPQDVTMALAKIWEHLADVKQRDVNRPHGRCWLSSLWGAIAQKVEAIASRLESLGGKKKPKLEGIALGVLLQHFVQSSFHVPIRLPQLPTRCKIHCKIEAKEDFYQFQPQMVCLCVSLTKSWDKEPPLHCFSFEVHRYQLHTLFSALSAPSQCPSSKYSSATRSLTCRNQGAVSDQ